MAPPPSLRGFLGAIKNPHAIPEVYGPFDTVSRWASKSAGLTLYVVENLPMGTNRPVSYRSGTTLRTVIGSRRFNSVVYHTSILAYLKGSKEFILELFYKYKNKNKNTNQQKSTNNSTHMVPPVGKP
jgi:hypothetical protein